MLNGVRGCGGWSWCEKVVRVRDRSELTVGGNGMLFFSLRRFFFRIDAPFVSQEAFQ